MKLKFKKSPTGAFKLGYHVGQTATIKDKELAQKLVSQGYAEVVQAAAGKKDPDAGKGNEEGGNSGKNESK